MKAFWNDLGKGLKSEAAREVSLQEALWIWSDEVHGVEGNFLGLIDDENLTIQFYFEAGIPNHVEDARHFRVVLMDFPRPELGGSFAVTVAIGEVPALIDKAFRNGADHAQYEGIRFQRW